MMMLDRVTTWLAWTFIAICLVGMFVVVPIWMATQGNWGAVLGVVGAVLFILALRRVA